MGKYDPQAAMALRMISAKGGLVTMTRPGVIVDPVTQATVDDSSTYDVRVVGIPLSPREARRQFGDAINVSIARLSVFIAMSGAAQTPRGGDRFTWGGKAYQLMMDPELLDPAGEGAAILASGFAEAA